MKYFIVQSKLLGMAALALLAFPVIAQSPVSPEAPLAPVPAVPAAAPLPSDGLPALNLPTVAAPSATAIAASPAAVAVLPAVTAPSEGVVAPVATAAAATESTTLAAPAEPKKYSYGDSELSILFLPGQITRMKESIRVFEDTGKDAEKPAPVVNVVAAPVAPEVIEDPLTYPVFYLSSIVYEGAGDWSLWLSGYKITSRRNYTDVTVLNVTRDSATFLWKPSFMKAITKREKEKLFVPTDSVKHKLVPTQSVRLDAAASAIIFTLKPNQSFAPGYFKTFEGYIDGPTLTALPVVVATGGDAGQPVPFQPAAQLFDANGNPINNDQSVNNPASYDPSSTNVSPPSR